MATIRITLPLPVNTSLQPKVSSVASDTSNTADSGGWDIIYFVKMVDGKQSGGVIELGECIAVVQGATTYTVDIQTDGNEILPVANDYIFFGKNNKISTSSLSGYFADVQMTNDSTAAAELFAVSAQV